MGDEAARRVAGQWALERIAEVTQIPFDRRGDLGFLRTAVSLAHNYAKAGLLGKEPPATPDLEGQADLFAPPNQTA